MNWPGKNADGQTSLGGHAAGFPRTTWGLISRCRDAEALERQRAGMEDLCRRYWKPVYCYIRMRRGKTNEDAKDLTQAFFLRFLEGETLKRYAPERGSFRRYLKVLLGGFLTDQDRETYSLKRGGGAKILPLDAGDLSLDDTIPDSQAVDPEKEFDRRWAIAVARSAIDRVRARYQADGRALPFQAYEAYEMPPAGTTTPTYAEVAARLGMKEHDVRHALSEVRNAVHDELQAELSSLMTDVEDLEEEWNALFGR